MELQSMYKIHQHFIQLGTVHMYKLNLNKTNPIYNASTVFLKDEGYLVS